MNDADDILTVTQVAELLQVPESTIYRWRYVHSAPPAMRVGRHLRFRRSDIDAWLTRRVS